MSIICNSCKCENRDIAKFCKSCGSKMQSGIALDNLEGLDQIKTALQQISSFAKIRQKRLQSGSSAPSMNLHTLIIGNTGTGKTALATALCKLYHSLEIVKKDEPVIIDAVDFNDFLKDFKNNFLKAKNGILFIDNVQKLVPAGYAGQVTALDKLFPEMDRNGNDPIVILAGLPEGFREYIAKNPDVINRFNHCFDLPDYSASELCSITIQNLSKQGFSIDPEASNKLSLVYKYQIKNKDSSFGNAHLAYRQTEDIVKSYFKRVSLSGVDDSVVLADDINGTVTIEKSTAEILAELDTFVGMESVKSSMKDCANRLEMQKKQQNSGSIDKKKFSMHTVITGNPGTGKTSIARTLGEILCSLGYLDRGHVIEVDRSKIVAQYLGQTAPLVNDLCNQAMGGILFIDEAYTLAGDPSTGSVDTFGKEAIEALMKRMEDDRDKFVVIAAGYNDLMDRFLNSNPGLRSRFSNFLHIDDYKPDELSKIYNGIASKNGYTISTDAQTILLEAMTKLYNERDKNFGNGRDVRRIFEETEKNLSKRILNTGENQQAADFYKTILAEDVPYTPSKTPTIDSVMKSLNDLTGMDDIKREISDLVKMLTIQSLRMKQQGTEFKYPLHIIITGNPGTGKTTVARILAKVFCALGMLPTDKVVEVNKMHLVGQYIGTTPKKTNDVIDSALGGVLFIDEAYTLAPEGIKEDFGKEAIETLLVRMENDRGKFIAIAAGYKKEMANFISANPGLHSRFNKQFHLEDYTAQEMVKIYTGFAERNSYKIHPDANEQLLQFFKQVYETRDSTFANGRTVRNCFDGCVSRQSVRLAGIENLGDTDLSLLLKEDMPPITSSQDVSIQEAIDKINSLTGLGGVKQQVKAIIDYINMEKIRSQASGTPVSNLSLHFVFSGNPGTGKTTVARLLSQVFKSLGLLSKGHLVEIDRSALVAGYVGQTAIKTNEKINEAMGGMLFIDEAYTLTPKGSENDFGKEAIDILLKRMEDDRGKFIVVAAGYKNEMEQFINANPGLPSRFTRTIHFDDYSDDEMTEIFIGIAKKSGRVLNSDALDALPGIFREIRSKEGSRFANGRTARNLFEHSLEKMAMRLSSKGLSTTDSNDINTIILQDII